MRATMTSMVTETRSRDRIKVTARGDQSPTGERGAREPGERRQRRVAQVEGRVDREVLGRPQVERKGVFAVERTG